MTRPGPAAGLCLLLALADCGAAASHGVPRASRAATDATPATVKAPPRPASASSDGDGDLERVQAGVAALRELPFRRRVASSPQSRAQFRQVVHDEIGRELGPAKNLAVSRALAHAGFLPLAIDLAATLEEAETTQVAAYYDPRTEQFHTVSVSGGPAEREVIVAHELTHALQDQYFDLIAYDGGPDNAHQLSDDERAARRFVVEGEATFVMLAYQAASGQGAGRTLGPLQVAGVRMTLTMLAAIDYVDMLATVRVGEAANKLDAETRAALDALAAMPPLVATSLVDPYIRGAFLVSEAWARGGWPRVAQLYRDPPRSTEQALHPIEKLLDARDPPIEIRLPTEATAATAAPPLLQQTMGELDWRSYFKTWADPEPERDARGWGGDLLTVWERAGGLLALTATRWDTPADAERFEQAYRRSLRRRFPAPHDRTRPRSKARAAPGPAGASSAAVAATTEAATGAIQRRDGTAIMIERRGLDVDIVDGARPGEVEPLLALLRAAERTPDTAPPRPPPAAPAPASPPGPPR